MKIFVKKAKEILIEHSIFFVMVLILASFVYVIRDDYVVMDAFKEQGEDYFFVTKENPLYVDIAPTGDGLNSIFFNMRYPSEALEEFVTTVSLSENETVFYQQTFKNDSTFEISGQFGQAVEFNFEDIDTRPDAEYRLTITSNATNESNAFGFCKDAENNLWYRLSYLLLSKGQRKWTSFFFVFFFSAFMYLLIQKSRYKSMFEGSTKQHSKISRKPEMIFLLFSIPLCLLYLISVPIFRVPDEVNHYVRTYGILHGNFLVPSNGYIEIPENLIPFPWYTYTPYILFKNRVMRLSTQGVIGHDAVNMALYSPISYILQIPGVGLGEVISHNTYVMVFLGSLFNLAGCTAILYYSIKYIPYGKWCILFVSLTPMAIQERASLSVDAITYAMAVAVLAFCLSMRCGIVKMDRKKIILMYLILFLLASCKVVYFVIGFLILFIPWECFGSKKKSVFHKIMGSVMLMVMALGWFLIASKYLGTTRGGGSTAEKVQYMIQNPGQYLYIMDKTIWEEGAELFLQMIGSRLGSLDIIVNHCLIIMILVLGIVILSYERSRRKNPDSPMSAVLLVLALGNVILIFTSLYIQWTELAESKYEIQGLQGRYFLPVLPLLLCALVSSRQHEKIDEISLTKPAYALYVLNLIVIITIFSYSAYR